MSLITFDWAQIAYIGSPLATPWWAEANIVAGFVFFFCKRSLLIFITLIGKSLIPFRVLDAHSPFHQHMEQQVHAVSHAAYLTIMKISLKRYLCSISSRGSFDNKGKKYDVTKIINPDATFNQEEYENYSPLFISTTFAISYGLSFASITATLTHAFLYFRKQIWTQARRAMHEQPDIHARLMSRYPQVPEWWYAIIFREFTRPGFGEVFLICLTSDHVRIRYHLDRSLGDQVPCSILHSRLGHRLVSLNVLSCLLSEIFLPAFFYVIPIGMIQAITNQQVGLNVITELIIGYALPGRPVAMMMFKTWGYITMAQALTFTSDFKLGHYMKIPPRSMFWAQVVATVIAGTVQLGVQAWMFTNIPMMCDPDQKDGFICPSTEVFGTASIIWGVIGPARQFSKGQVYYALTIFFLVGFICPVITYAFSLKFPNSWLRYLNFPVIFSGTGSIPPASAVNYVPWGIVGFIFQYVIRRRHFSWWTKYNYVLSAALDSGVAVAAVLIFFILQYPKNGDIGIDTVQSWWGNT